MLSDYLNSILDMNINFRIASNLLLGDISAYLNKEEKVLKETTLTTDRFIELVNLLADETLTSKNLKDIITKVMESTESIENIIKESGIKNITDDSMIKETVKKVISENPKSVQDYKEGHDRATKFLMGQIMKETKGSVNPKMAMDILIKELNI